MRCVICGSELGIGDGILICASCKDKTERKEIEAETRREYGWICPKCGGVNAPWVEVCLKCDGVKGGEK